MQPSFYFTPKEIAGVIAIGINVNTGRRTKKLPWHLKLKVNAAFSTINSFWQNIT